MREEAKFSSTICPIPVPPFDYIVKAGQTGRPKTVKGQGEIMPQYLVATYLPGDYDQSTEDEAMARDVATLEDEMVAAGVKISFRGGLSAARSARSERLQPGGKVLIADGPYLETNEHIGGFSVLEDVGGCTRMGAKLPLPVGRRSRCARFGGPARELSGSDDPAGDAGLAPVAGAPPQISTSLMWMLSTYC
jgi:hypothetical protein